MATRIGLNGIGGDMSENSVEKIQELLNGLEEFKVFLHGVEIDVFKTEMDKFGLQPNQDIDEEVMVDIIKNRANIN